MIRIKLDLDARIEEEATVIGYLNQLPKARQNEQIRRLLLQGFKYSTAHTGDIAPNQQPTVQGISSGDAKERRNATSTSDAPPIADVPAKPPTSDCVEPTLASLRAVIG